MRVLVTDKNVRLLGADHVSAEQESLDQQVRESFHKKTVFEGTRLALVGIDYHILLCAWRVAHDLPLHISGKPGPAHAPQSTLVQCLDDLVDVLRCEHLAQRSKVLSLLGIRVKGERSGTVLHQGSVRNCAVVESG